MSSEIAVDPTIPPGRQMPKIHRISDELPTGSRATPVVLDESMSGTINVHVCQDEPSWLALQALKYNIYQKFDVRSSHVHSK